MVRSQFDVVIVGAGCAGLTAAIGLARSGFRVAVVEAADFPGAENWSGCVYFTENLSHPDLLGPEGVEALAWERRLVERGFFATDGHGLFGMTYRDADAFRHCYTVLRPIYDYHLSQIALSHGVVLLAATTAESLIRDGGRVIGVCTNRGPLYANLVFLAEGDASHLVTREGYERSPDPRDAPRFLLGIKQIIELPPGAVEERFGVGPEEGAAYELLLRNGTLNGRPVHLNARGFLYTNRQSLSVGLVLPAEHLAHSFDGDPNRLLEWFEDLPALRPWLRDGRRGTFGAKLLRGGGLRDVPHLIDDGLAIGGAASAIGTDFPFPNFTGPATAMGLLLARAAARIRAEGSGFTRENLRRHYLEPLQQTRYWQDVTFLRRWPGYIKKTRVFFDQNLDVILGSAYVWTRPRGWLPGKLVRWLRLLRHLAGPGRWGALRGDLFQLGWALRLREVAGRPALARLLLDGSLNALRDLLRRPRAHVPAAGTLRLHYVAAGGAVPSRSPPWLLRRWFGRFAPVLAAAARTVLRNDDVPLPHKLADAGRLLLRQINLLDLAALAGLAVATAVASGLATAWGWLRRSRVRPLPRVYREYATAVRQTADLTAAVGPAARQQEDRLAGVVYHGGRESNVHVLWPRSLAEKNAIARQGLDHVCPARVFEIPVGPSGQARVVVHSERCIQCEACWRVSDLVDWGRDGHHHIVYLVASPVVERLLQAADAAGLARPAQAYCLDVWASQEQVGRLLDQLERKLEEFDRALGKEPCTIDRARSEYLEMLARYAQQLSLDLMDLLYHVEAKNKPVGPFPANDPILALTSALAAKAEERARRTWDQRFAWAAADGRHVRQHHLAGLRRLLGTLPGPPLAIPEGWQDFTTFSGSGTSDKLQPCRESMANSVLALADFLCRRAVEHATTHVRFPGRFHDERGRDTVGKFGAFKRLIAEMAARRFLIETLANHHLPPDRVQALTAEALADVADRAEQVFGAAGLSADDELARSCRVAASWRFRDPPAFEMFRTWGEELARGWLADGSRLAVVGPTALFEEIVRRKALQAEWDEVRRNGARLTRRVNDWLGRAKKQPDSAADAEITEALGRQDAYHLASMALLARTHGRLENGQDAALEISLLRVWLEDASASLDEFASLVRRRLNPPHRRDDRPIVEPGAHPPVTIFADFLASAAPYESGDFLITPVDLLQPRLVPEMAETDPAFTAVGHPFLSFAAPIRGFIERSRARALSNPENRLPEDALPAQVAWRLQRMEEDGFTAEALAFDVTGRSEHPGTRSAVQEMAAARLLLAELLRRVSQTSEEIRALTGQGEENPLERKEVRVSANDEGADTLRRFLILRDLVAEVAPRWKARTRPVPRHLGRETLELEALKAGFRQRLEAARDVFGQDLWQNPNLQANCFALAEAAAWLKAADSTLGRIAWLIRHAQTDEETEPAPKVALGRRALARCFAEVNDRLRRFGEELAHLRRGFYAPQVRAASLLFDRPTSDNEDRPPTSRIRRPLAVLVVLRPAPLVAADQSQEAFWCLGEADRAALETALRLRDKAPDLVTIQAMAAGPERLGQTLREVLSLGVDKVYLAVEDSTTDPGRKTTTLPAMPPGIGPFELLLGGAGGPSEEPLVRLLADALGVPYGGLTEGVTVDDSPNGVHQVRMGTDFTPRTMPLAVAVKPSLALRAFTVDGFLAGLSREVKAVASCRSLKPGGE